MEEPDWVREKGSEKLVEEGTAESSPTSTSRSSTRPSRRRRGLGGGRQGQRPISGALCFFRLLTGFTCLLALLTVVVNCYSIYEDTKDSSVQARAAVIRCYGIIFSIMTIFTELELRGFMRYFAFMKNWLARGLAYMFLGVISYDPEAGKGSGYNIFNEVSSGLMFGVGCLYFLMGVACMQTVKEAETRQLSSGQLSDEDD